MTDELDVLLTRATSRHIDRVIVAGRDIARDGKVLGINLDTVAREVLAGARAAGKTMCRFKPAPKGSQAKSADYCRDGRRAGG